MDNRELLNFSNDIAVDHIVPSHLGSGSTRPNIPRTHVSNKRMKLSTQSAETDHRRQRMEVLRNELHAVAQNVLLARPVGESYASVYRKVELLSIYKHSEQAKLADYIFKAIEEHYTQDVFFQLKAMLEGESLSEEKITYFLTEYDNWNGKLVLLLKLYLYLDRAYLLQHPKKLTICECGLEKFVNSVLVEQDASSRFHSQMPKILIGLHKSILMNARLHEDASTLLLAKKLTICAERLDPKGELQINRVLADSVIANYNFMKQDWLEQNERYIPLVLTSVCKEMEFFREAGKSDEFVNALVKKLNWHLIFQDFVNIIEPSLPFLLNEEGFEYLTAIAKFCASSMNDYGVDSVQSLVYVWGKFVLKTIIAQIAEAKSSNAPLVPLLVTSWEELNLTLSKCFTEESFSYEMRSSLSKALSERTISGYVLMQLSKFCESFFKQSGKKLFIKFEAEVLIVFKALSNKADFIKIYERDMSKRMLMGRTFNITSEKRLVDALLKVVGESDEGQNLRAMFRDVEFSHEHYTHVPLDAAPDIEFNALVLEKNYWPDIPKVATEIVLPDKLSLVLSEFTCKYHEESEKLKYHKLDWSNYTLHQVTILAQFDKGPRELQLNILQAVVLLIFEESNSFEYAEVVSRTQIESKLLKRVLASLSSERLPILKVENGLIVFNNKFSDGSTKTVRVPMSRDKDGVVLEDALKVVKRSRTSEIRAAIVRTMKQDRTLLYPELLGKVIKLLKGTDTILIQELKSNVEHLISNEYITRDPDGQTLIYVP